MSERTTRIRFRQGETSDWTAADPVLASGEPAYDRSSGQFKIGDGITPYSGLSSFGFSTPNPVTYTRVLTPDDLADENIPANVDLIALITDDGLLQHIGREANATPYQSADGQYWAVVPSDADGVGTTANFVATFETARDNA